MYLNRAEDLVELWGEAAGESTPSSSPASIEDLARTHGGVVVKKGDPRLGR